MAGVLAYYRMENVESLTNRFGQTTTIIGISLVLALSSPKISRTLGALYPHKTQSTRAELST